MRLNHIDSGEGPPVVLLHGLFGAARNFGACKIFRAAEKSGRDA